MDDLRKQVTGNLGSKQESRVVITGLLLAIFMLGMALRLYQLDADSMWLDEIITAEQGQQGLLFAGTDYMHNPNPRQVYVLTWFFMRVAGNSEFVLRVQPMLFGSLSILLIYKVGKILWTRSVGLLASFLLAVNAYHIRYSQEVRPYALMVFLALLSLIFLYIALQKNKTRFWLGFVLCTSSSLYNHYFAFLFLPAEVIFAAFVIAQNWLSHRGKNGRASEDHASRGLSVPAKQALMFCLSLAVVGLSYLPWVPALQTHIPLYRGSLGGTVGTAGSLESSLSFLQHTVLTDFSGMSSVALLIWVGMFVVGLAASDLKRIALVASWVGTPFVFLAVVQGAVRAKPRYVLFILPLCLLVIARGIVLGARSLGPHLPGAKGDREWAVRIVGALAVLIVASLSVAPLRDYYLWEKDDWRGAARYLANNMEPGDILIVDGKSYWRGLDSRTPSRCLSYYLGSHDVADIPILRVERGLWEDLQSVQQDEAEVWAALFYRNRPARWERTKEIALVDFSSLAIIRLREPSGHLPEDTVSLLHVLLELLPPEADFDIHLALAEIYLRPGATEQARLQLDLASEVIPSSPRASRDLSEARAELQQVSYPIENIQHPLWRNLGEVVAFLGYNMNTEAARHGDSLRITLWWQTLDEMDRDYSVFVHVLDQDDRIWAQHDQLLQRGPYPTSTWPVEETVGDEYQLQLAPDTPPGEYTVKAGIYYWETQERLPVWDEHGLRAAEDAIVLDSVIVVE